MFNRKPTKENFLKFFREHGSKINTIIDIGVQYETRELKEIYKDAFHLLFEPCKHYIPSIKKTYNNINHIIINKAVGNENKKGYLKEMSIYNTSQITHASITNDNNYSEIDIINLDYIVDNYKFESPCILKIDTDGNEEDILKSGNKIFKYCDIIIVESWINKVGLFCNLLQNKNYKLYDIIDLCYIKGTLSQVDLVFIKDDLFQNAEKYKELNPVKYYNKILKKNIWNESNTYYPLKFNNDKR